jgi:hypothetical protein
MQKFPNKNKLQIWPQTDRYNVLDRFNTERAFSVAGKWTMKKRFLTFDKDGHQYLFHYEAGDEKTILQALKKQSMLIGSLSLKKTNSAPTTSQSLAGAKEK